MVLAALPMLFKIIKPGRPILKTFEDVPVGCYCGKYNDWFCYGPLNALVELNYVVLYWFKFNLAASGLIAVYSPGARHNRLSTILT